MFKAIVEEIICIGKLDNSLKWSSDKVKKFMVIILKLKLSFLGRNETFDSLLWYLFVSDNSLFNMQYGFAIEHWSYGTGLLCDTVTWFWLIWTSMQSF